MYSNKQTSMDIYYDQGDSDEEEDKEKPKFSSDHVYESVNVKAEPTAENEEGFNLKITKKCLIILVLSVFLVLAIVIGTSVSISYQVTKEKLTKKSREGCVELDGWFNISTECFKFVEDACETGCTWEQSVKVCKKLGGKLAEPRTDSSMSKLMDHGPRNKKLKFWIGLVNIDGDGNFEWASDKSPASFNKSFWSKDEPTYDGPYVHFYGGTMQLNDRNDFHRNKPICQKAVDENIGECKKDGWVSRKGQCYKFMTKSCPNGCSWAEAVSMCKTYAGKLTEGPDFQFLRNIAKGLSLKMTTNWWIGFSDLDTNGTYVRESDGKEVNLTKFFASGEPSSKTEHCLEMRDNLDMKLNDKNCDIADAWEKTFQPLCQKSLATKNQGISFTIVLFGLICIWVYYK